MPPKGGARQGARLRSLDEQNRSRSPLRETGTGGRSRGGSRQDVLLRAGAATPSHSSHQAVDPEVPQEEQEFRDYIRGLFLRNKLSGKETVTLVQKANAAGAKGLARMRNAAGGGKHMKNASRDLMAQFLKTPSFPPEYLAEIPLLDKNTGIVSRVPLQCYRHTSCLLAW